MISSPQNIPLNPTSSFLPLLYSSYFSVYSCLFLCSLFPLISFKLSLKLYHLPLPLIDTHSHPSQCYLSFPPFFHLNFGYVSFHDFHSTPHLLYALIMLQTICDPDCLLLSPLAAPPLLLINHLTAAFSPCSLTATRPCQASQELPPRGCCRD